MRIEIRLKKYTSTVKALSFLQIDISTHPIYPFCSFFRNRIPLIFLTREIIVQRNVYNTFKKTNCIASLVRYHKALTASISTFFVLEE